MKLSNIDVKKQNKIIVYKKLLKLNSVSYKDLANELNMSLPTVTQNVKYLINENLAKEGKTLESTGGRRATTVKSLENSKIAFGVDITQNHVGYAITNLKGQLLDHDRVTLKFSNTDEYFLKVANQLDFWFKKHIKDEKDVIGVGVSVPGIVSKDGSILLRSHLLNIEEPTKFKLLELIPFKTKLFNDATASCHAEVKLNPNLKNLVFLSLSNSVGGAFLIDGKLFKGNNQHSGEFGHATLFPKGKKCYCGQKGHFDCYCNATVLSNNTNGKLELFFKELNLGNTKFEKIFNDYLKNLALMINNILMVFDCDIIIGGYVGSYIQPYLNQLKEEINQINSFQDSSTQIMSCKFKVEASAVGCSNFFIDKFINNI